MRLTVVAESSPGHHFFQLKISAFERVPVVAVSGSIQKTRRSMQDFTLLLISWSAPFSRGEADTIF